METIIFIGKFIVGLIMILKGADHLTDGAASIARKFGISTMVIGLTIVACGTSAPEFVVSFMSAINNKTEMAIGNVVGSNIFNILAIIGATALVRPIKALSNNIRNDVPFCVLAAIAIFAMSCDNLIDGNGRGNMISCSEGMVLICMFLIFMRYTFAIAKAPDDDNGTQSDSEKQKPLRRNIFLVIIGLCMLVIGGDWMVDGASGIARMIGVSEAIIALTIVSIGTSAPEFATSIVAARKGDTDMAMGNVVGSILFNALFVLGISALVNPLQLGDVTIVDMATLLGASLMFWVFCKFGKSYHEISRTEGGVMVGCMVLYYAYLIMNTTSA